MIQFYHITFHLSHSVKKNKSEITLVTRDFLIQINSCLIHKNESKSAVFKMFMVNILKNICIIYITCDYRYRYSIYFISVSNIKPLSEISRWYVTLPLEQARVILPRKQGQGHLATWTRSGSSCLLNKVSGCFQILSLVMSYARH